MRLLYLIEKITSATKKLEEISKFWNGFVLLNQKDESFEGITWKWEGMEAKRGWGWGLGSVKEKCAWVWWGISWSKRGNWVCQSCGLLRAIERRWCQHRHVEEVEGFCHFRVFFFFFGVRSSSRASPFCAFCRCPMLCYGSCLSLSGLCS